MSDAVDLGAIKQAQQRVWSEGDFAMVAGLVMMVSEELVEALDIVPGERVLDVACGSGNGALAAARRCGATRSASTSSPRCLSAGASGRRPSGSRSSSSRATPPTYRLAPPNSTS
ncbi:MAG TPA: hypothetical protein VGN84_03655 [Solirubrobacterales bacterium]|nr:hypothetical protein [Solirubrobacterales bacterium]